MLRGCVFVAVRHHMVACNLCSAVVELACKLIMAKWQLVEAHHWLYAAVQKLYCFCFVWLMYSHVSRMQL
jgi:hypothetical protein